MLTNKITVVIFISQTNKKAHRPRNQMCFYSKSEISMKQTASHSQTPQFGVNKSATSARLYQHPTEAEQRPTGWKNAINSISMIMVLASMVAGCTVMLVKGCEAEQNRQSAIIQTQLLKGSK